MLLPSFFWKEIMKRRIMVVIALIAMVLFSSCLSTKTSGSGNTGVQIRGVQENPNKLLEKQLLAGTTPVQNPEYMTLSNWSKVRATSEILDLIDGHKYFSNSEKVQFMSYLFDELPINGKDGVAREVHVGKFFEDGTNLIIRLGTFTAGADAALASDKVIVIITNMIKMNDGSTNRKTGAFIHLNLNESMIFILKDSLLTDSQNVQEEEISPNSWIEMESFEKLMFAQALLKDDKLENDFMVADIVDKIIEDNTEIPAIVIMAMIFKYDYLLSLENITQAEVLWQEILAYSEQVPGDMTPENLEALNGETLYMMKSLLGYFEQ